MLAALQIAQALWPAALLSNVAEALADGTGSLLVGLPRPVFWLVIAWLAIAAPRLTKRGTKLIAAGAIGSALSSAVLVFNNAAYSVAPDLLTTAEVGAVVALGLVTLGLAFEAIHLGGLVR